MTGNTIAGQATVERYFSQLRKWQYLSVPTDNTQTVKAAWQEGATMISQNPAAGFGMQITQFTGGTGLGFDAFSPGGPSVKTYNPATDNYTGITNTTNPIKTTGGYMAFVRGDRLSLGSPATTTNPTTLRTKGLLYTGTQPVINAGANLFAGIGNPYASGVTISDLVMTGLVGTTPARGTIYVWDPSLPGSFGLGGFQTLTFNSGTAVYDATPGGGLFGATCNRLESGQAFFTRGGGAGGTLTFSETAKATGSSLVSFTGSHTGMAATLRIHLYAKSIGNTALVDGTLTYFNEDFSDGTDGMDASKLTNTGENLGIASNGATLAVDYRSMPDNNDTIFLSSKNLKAAKYKFQIFAADLALAGREAFLEDKYLLTKTPLYLTDTTDADFEVINVPGSYAADRFFITFKYTAPPVAITDLTAVRLPAKTAEIKWKAQNEAAIARYETEHSLYGTDFRKLGATAAHNNAGGNAAYSFTDLSASAEENYYRVKGIAENGEIFYSGVAKLEALPGKSLITVSPNPVTGKTIHLVMSGQLPGAYSLRLINDAGQVIYTGVVQLNTNFQNFDIALNKTTAAGVYTLFIHRDNGKNLSLRVSIN